jgi:hypothetical protein
MQVHCALRFALLHLANFFGKKIAFVSVTKQEKTMKKLALLTVLLGGAGGWFHYQRWLNSLEHKTEHNNCRMRGTDSNLEASSPTVSTLLRVRAARKVHLENRCTGNRTGGSNPSPSATQSRCRETRVRSSQKCAKWPLSERKSQADEVTKAA